jgi:hypothetical protein
LRSAFRKISRVGSLSGGTKWYLSEDCLFAAKRVMYTVEYRRFYLRDLESIVVWPNRLWLLRAIIPGVLLVALSVWLWHWALGASLWRWRDFATGAVFAGMGLTWTLLELVLGPTAKARIQTTGATVDLPLVKRARRARQVLEKIDAALRAARGGVLEPTSVPVTAPAPRPAASSSQTNSETTSATAPVGDLT